MSNILKKRYYSMQDVCQYCDLKPHILRYWEKKTPIVSPVRLRNNRRHYTRHCFDQIVKLNYLINKQGYSIGDAVAFLEEGDFDARLYWSTLAEIEAIVSE